MLYEEFAENVKCRDNEHNHKVFRELEIIYTNTDCTKEHIYEMGRKLVDNRKSEGQLKIEAKVKAEIAEAKEQIDLRKEWIEQNKVQLDYWKKDGDKEMIKFYQNAEKWWKADIKDLRNRISALKWVLA